MGNKLITSSFMFLVSLMSCTPNVDFRNKYIGLSKDEIIRLCGSSYEQGVNKFGQEFLLYEKSKFEGATFYFDDTDSCILASIWLNDSDLTNCKNHMNSKFELVKQEGTSGSTYYYYSSRDLKYRLFDGGKDGGILDMAKHEYDYMN